MDLTAKETVNMQVTSWLLEHKEEIDLTPLRGLNDEQRRNHPVFINIEQRIFDDFINGSNIQKNMFLYVPRSEFRTIVSDRVGGFDEVMEMAYNFSLLPNPFADC